jgi:lysine 2,3-aminomutase
VVAPMRLNAGLIDVLSRYHKLPHKELIIVTHFQHSAEITPEAMQATQALASRGIKLYNQAVFTTANSRRFEICALRIALRRIGVDPYYLFNAKAKKEIPGYGVPIARLQQEFKEEARLMPGTVRTDIPVYNIPRLGKNYITAWQHHRLIMILPDGRRLYEFDPWEKGISLTDVFVESDESIYDFLEHMKKMGENPEDYRSIWYYF